MVRDKKTHLPGSGSHALDGPSNSRNIARVPGLPLNIVEPEHAECAAGRLQAEADADVLRVVLPAARAAEPGAQRGEVFFEHEGGVGLRDYAADVHDCAEEGGFGGEVDGDFGAFVVGFEGAGESGLGEGHWCGLAVFFATVLFFRGVIWPMGCWECRENCRMTREVAEVSGVG